MQGCPAGIDVPRYIGYVALGKWAEATAVVRERIPFPSVCGYICYRPCEPVCRRALWEAPVAINAIKRAAAERDSGLWRRNWDSTIAPSTGKRVAIVGSGPAGLTAAYYLGKVRGHNVTVFEAAPKPGGQLRLGVPINRLPRQAIREEIRVISENRVEIRCHHRVNSLDDLLAQGYHAVFLSVGSSRPQKLEIPGEELPGVWEGVRFLEEANLGLEEGRPVPVRVGGRAAIIGAGNVAVDCARTALRLGAKEVTIVYRRTRQEMPAYDFEMRAAEVEGIQVHFLAAPVRIERKDGLLGLHLVRMRLGEHDASGRRRPVPIPGEEFSVQADTVIAAIGQVPDVPLAWGLALNADGTIKASPETLETSRPGVFAGGDVVLGPANIIKAIGHGRKAAQAIDHYLGGDGDIEEVLVPSPGEEMELHPEIKPDGSSCVSMEEATPSLRAHSFELVEKGYTEVQAREEALRCVRCDLWSAKGIPGVWWKKRGLQPYWVGEGWDRMGRDRDRAKAKVFGPYPIRYDHAPYIPDEYRPAAADE